MPVRRWLTRLAVLVVILLLVLAAMVALAVRKHTDDDIEAQRPIMLASAERYAVALSSLSSGRDQTELDELKTLATGTYQVSLAGQGPAMHEVFKIGDVRSVGKVAAIGVEHLDERTAATLVSVETQVSDVKVPAGEVRRYRLSITLERVADRWLVSFAEIVK